MKDRAVAFWIKLRIMNDDCILWIAIPKWRMQNPGTDEEIIIRIMHSFSNSYNLVCDYP